MDAASGLDLRDLKLEVSGAPRRRERRISFKGNTMFLSLFRPLTSNKLRQMRFPSFSRVVKHSSVNQLQRLQIDSCARARTPRTQICFVPFSQVIFGRPIHVLQLCPSSPKARLALSIQPGHTSSPVPTSTTQLTRTPSRTSRSTSPVRPPPSSATLRTSTPFSHRRPKVSKQVLNEPEFTGKAWAAHLSHR